MKPRLRRWYGRWECFGGYFSCLGDTPVDAYIAWLRAGLARYDFGG